MNSTILQRIAGNDKTAVEDCILVYGNLIWALARKFTVCREEAEEAALEIFRDVWKCAAGFYSTEIYERNFIKLIAYRRLVLQSSSRKQNTR